MDYSTLLLLDCKTTIWENSTTPTGQTNEVIGIDVAIVDTAKNQVVEQELLYIKPKKSKISSYCERLFGISQNKADNDGVSFEEAYRKIRIHYMSRDRLWGGWGSYEKYILDKQCRSLKLESLFTQPHHDIQHWFSLMTGASSAPTLESALKYVEVAPVMNTAVNVANVYMKMAKGLRPSIIKTRIVVPSTYKHTN